MIGANSEIIESLDDWERLAEPKTEFQWVGRAMRNIRASVIQKGTRLLVCQRAAEKRHGGLWEFPGGTIE